MIKILGFTSILLFGILSFNLNENNDSFKTLWAQVSQFEKDKKPKSALKIIEKIYEKAQKENEQIHLTKAIVFKAKFLLQTQEEGYEKVVVLFKDEIKKSSSPTKEILLSVEASMYHTYLQSNYYDINQRNRIDAFQENNPTTWPVNTFIEKIAQNYKASIATSKNLDLPLKEFDDLLEAYDKESLRDTPTLYDVLAARAIEFFTNNNTYLTAPIYQFTIDDPDYFSQVDHFSNVTITSQDSSSLLFNGIKVIQNHLKYHSDNAKPKAYLNVKRLELFYNHSNLENKDELYLKRLFALEKEYEKGTQHAAILGLLAQYYNQRSQFKDERSDDFIVAKKFAKKAIDLYPKSAATNRCFNIYNNITQVSLNHRIENVYPSNKDFLIHLGYKNLQKAHLKIVKLTKEEVDKISNERKEEKKFKIVNNKTAIRKRAIDLFNDNKHYDLSTEVSIKGLDYGFYGLMVASNEKFENKNGGVNVSILNISDLAFEYRSTKQNHKVFVVDRITGAPIKGAEVICSKQEYNRNLRKNIKSEIGRYISDLNGAVALEHMDRSLQIEIINGEDYLGTQRASFYRMRTQNSGDSFIIFNDRGIYRPGQTIHYKLLALKRNERQIPSPKDSEKVIISLVDANGQEISKNEQITNSFGSCHGSFTVPASGLKGRYTIKVNQHFAKALRVEEYKRPKFEVTKIPLDKLYALNDTVNVKAKALSYAGAPIDQAKFVYRVTRNVSFPWWHYGCGYRYPLIRQNDVEITNGVGYTNEKGEAIIDFIAKPNANLSLDKNPLFHYQVKIDVTDMNGETQSINHSVRIGTRTRLLDIISKNQEQVYGAKNHMVELKVVDLNGEPKSGVGTLEVFALKEPLSVKNKRFWPQPTTINLDESEFEKLHPNYAYENEDYSKWSIDSKVETIEFDHIGIKKYQVAKGNSGVLKLVAKMKDVDNNWIEKVAYIQNSDFDKRVFSKKEHLHIATDKMSYQPGDKVKVHLGSASKEINVMYRLEKDHSLIEEKWLQVIDHKELAIPVSENDRGGFTIHLTYVKNNREYTKRKDITVPWSNKELSIQFETFRDKTLPGSQEEYRLKISGPNKDKVTAELVAGMYDSSLDVFQKNQWNTNFYRNYSSRLRINKSPFNDLRPQIYLRNRNENKLVWKGKYITYPKLMVFGLSHSWAYLDYSEQMVEGNRIMTKSASRRMPAQNVKMDGVMMDSEEIGALPTRDVNGMSAYTAGISVESDEDQNLGNNSPKKIAPQIRKNLNETVFFFPNLYTDKNGDVILSFKMNEALTKWKLMTFAHTKDLQFGYDERTVITQKDLMVVPNLPRFLRDKDEIEIATKINNLRAEKISGIVRLELIDAINEKTLTTAIPVQNLEQEFDIEGNQSTVAKWQLNIPDRKVDAIKFRVVAISGKHTDGEESVVPVLTNKILVTETMPITVQPNESKSFSFAELAKAEDQIVHQNYTLEYSSNPAWYAIQAMPYIMEDGSRETSLSIFNRFYTNTLANSMVQRHPKVKAVFDQWKLNDSDALQSNLEKNEELKSVLLNETPWVRQALTETAQKKNIALLFDLNKMSNEQQSTFQKLSQIQKPDGGFAWCNEYMSNRFISHQILEGIGHLKRLGIEVDDLKGMNILLDRLLSFVDHEIVKEYEHITKRKDYTLSETVGQYLYARSFFLDKPYSSKAEKAVDYFISIGEKNPLKGGIYKTAMLGIAMNRFNKKAVSKKITESLIERSLTHPELGTYWNEGNGFNWYELPIERHSILIELMVETKHHDMVPQLKLWLLRNKQTNNWKTTKATAAAIYSLLIEDENDVMSPWVLQSSIPQIKVGGKELVIEDKLEAGTGYFKKQWNKNEVNASMANIQIKNTNDHVSWGSAYWQFFTEMEEVKGFKKTPLKVKKTLYKKVLDDQGEKIVEITNDNLNVGDLVVVRIELQSDRSMEYVHLKDLRASGLEPTSALSSYKWSHGLGYYQSSSDLATDFFIGYLPKGKYTFEYTLRAQHSGKFSNGITSIQSMYAPEYTSHSRGQRIRIN